MSNLAVVLALGLALSGGVEGVPQSERTEYLAQADSSKDPYDRAIESALQAVELGKVAQSQSDWATTARAWGKAARLLQLLNSDHPNYEAAQNKIVEYTKNFEYAKSKSGNLLNPTPPQPVRQGNCDPAYPDVCIPSGPDLNCKDIEFRNFKVLSPDPHRLDRDKDGIGCESKR